MKNKKIAIGALAVLAIMGSAPAWAFKSVKIATVTATVTTGGQKVADFSFAIRNVTDPFGANQPSLSWASGINPTVTSWVLANRFVVINATVTDALGGVQMYTDNTATDAVPQFVDPTPGAPGTSNRRNSDSAAGGLVQGASGQSGKVLSMAWSIKAGTKTIETGADGIGASDPNNGPDTGINNKFQWSFITDKYNVDGVDFNGDGNVTSPGDSDPFKNGAPYITMINSNGLKFGQAPTEYVSFPDGQNAYVYFEANFAGAAALQAYQTSTLRIEAFIE